MSVSPSTLSFQSPLARMRGGFRDALVLALVAAATTWVALLSWKGFAIDYSGFMGPLIIIGVVVALSGAVLRWLRVPGALLVLAQLVIVGMVVSLYITGSLVPIGEAWLRLEEAFQDASETARQYAAPVPRGVPPIDPLLIAGGAACMLLVDIMAGTLRRVPLAGLPLLTIYSIPVSLLGGGVSWIIFTLTTIGFLLMLYLQESRQIARWGRPLGNDGVDPSGFGVSNGALRSSAGAIGAAATALAIVVPALHPDLRHRAVRQRLRPGRRRQDQDREPDGRPQAGHPAGQRRPGHHHPDRRPQPELPAHLGAQPLLRQRVEPRRPSGTGRPARHRRAARHRRVCRPPCRPRSTTTSVSISQNFDSPWLPTQFPVSAIDATGDWRYDSSTMDVMSFDEDLRAGGMSYDMTAVEPDLDPEAMNTSPLASDMMGTQLTELPPGLSTSVRTLATRETAEFTGRFQKAVALQNYLRDNGNYDARQLGGRQRQRHPGGVPRRGLPGRADGLLRAVRGGDGRDGPHHQHPEPGGHRVPQADGVRSRHLRLQPARTCTRGPSCTSRAPAGCGSSPPRRSGPRRCRRYTEFEFPAAPETDLPSSAGSEDAENRPTLGADPKEQNPQDQAGAASGGIPWRPIAIGVLAVALLVGLAMLPRLVRRRRRERRLAEGPEPVWIELRDTVVDLGLTWPAGRSPRETGAHLVHYFGRPVGIDTSDRPRHGADVSPEGEAALHRIVSTIEQQRYARPGTDQAAILKADAETVIAALEGGVTRGARRRAEWLPRSLFASRRRPGTTRRRRATT